MIGKKSKENYEMSFPAGQTNAGLFRTIDKAFCLICGRHVKLADFEQAAECLKTDLRDIRRLAESRQLHRIHYKSGVTMICAESLFMLFESRQTRRLKPGFLRFDPADYKTSEDI